MARAVARRRDASVAPFVCASSAARRVISRSRTSGLPRVERIPRAADGHRGDAHGGQALRDRHALPVLAAGPAALVDGEVVRDHVHALERLRAVADDVHVLHRPGELAVLDEVAVLHVEREVARADVHLAVREVHAVDAPLHGADDLLGAVRAGQHVRGAHARQRRVAVALAAAVARGLDAVVARGDRVVQVGREHAVLHEVRRAGVVALVVDVDRAARALVGGVVHDVDERLGDPLADLVGVDRDALAVEVRLHAVADRLVEEDARGAGGEHDRHLARGRRHRVEEHRRPRDRLAHDAVEPLRRVEVEARRGRRRCSRSARAGRPPRRGRRGRGASSADGPRRSGRRSRR